MKKALLFSLGSGVEERLRLFRDSLSSDYEVEIYISDFNHTNKSYVTHFEDDLQYIHVPSYSSNLSFSRINSYLKFGDAVKKILSKKKPDLIYVMLPPNNVAAKCLGYLKERNAFFILDIYDLWPESLPLDRIKFKFNPIYSYWKNMRDKSIKRADYIFTECDLYREKLNYILEGRENISTLYLEKKMKDSELDEVRKQIDLYSQNFTVESNCIKLAYLGSINFIIDIPRISQIVRQLVSRGKQVQVHIIGTGEGLALFRKELNLSGAEVVYHGKIFDTNQKIELLSQCDFALNLMVDSVNVGLTTKSIDYFSMGLPLLNSIKGDTWNFVNNSGVGINDSELIVEKIIEAMSHKEQMTELHYNAFLIYKEKFTPEKFKDVVIRTLKEAGVLHDNN